MGDAYAIASLVVSRSGAGTTNELAATGRPAVLVPLVPTGRDEQRRIARLFAAAGAAIVIDNDALSGRRLAAETRQLLADPDRLAAMATAAAPLRPATRPARRRTWCCARPAAGLGETVEVIARRSSARAPVAIGPLGVADDRDAPLPDPSKESTLSAGSFRGDAASQSGQRRVR